MQLNIKGDIKAAEKALGALKKQVPFAAAYAMTQTARKVQQIERLEMQRVFKNPKRYTLNALYVRRAEKRDFNTGLMRARVWLIGAAGQRSRHYLYPQVRGGQRDHGGFERLLIKAGVLERDEYVVPGKHAGRITKGTYQKILAQLHAFNDAYQHATSSTRSRRNRRALQFYLVRDGKARGIWMRKGKQSVPVFIFVKQARYQKRLAFFDIAARVSAKYWPTAFNNAIQHAIQTAR